jgi:hypothetical protein
VVAEVEPNVARGVSTVLLSKGRCDIVRCLAKNHQRLYPAVEARQGRVVRVSEGVRVVV